MSIFFRTLTAAVLLGSIFVPSRVLAERDEALRLELRLADRVYQAGEPVVLTLSVRNAGNADVMVVHPIPAGSDDFIVRDARGEVARRREGILIGGSIPGTGPVLRPGEFQDSDVDLAKLYVLEPGRRYVVTAIARFKVGPVGQRRRVELHSVNAVRFSTERRF